MTSFIPSLPHCDAADVPSTEGSPEWIECPDCGLLQSLPQPHGRFDRACLRCDASFGSGTARFDTLFALSLAMIALFVLVNISPLLGIYIEGRYNTVAVADASHGLFKQNMVVLGTFVLGLTVLMPLAHMLLQSYVLFCLRQGKHPPHLARIFLRSEQVRPWAMLDVFLLGLFITVNKLRDMAQVQLMPSIWALACLIGLFLIFGTLIDRQKIWDSIDPPPPGAAPEPGNEVSCHACNMLHEAPGGLPLPGANCRRCATPLHHRKPDSIRRTWAFVLAGFVLYIPANLFPVMTVVTLGREHPTTILEGVQQLWNGSDWPYAILLFAASIVIPLFKLVGLAVFLLTFHLRRSEYLIHCTKLYRIFDIIGRWSVLDIFVAATLGALVDFGNLANSVPGPGLLPFASVVVFTMLAVSAFDPRLMWDAAGGNDE